jgi:hypothetical protein
MASDEAGFTSGRGTDGALRRAGVGDGAALGSRLEDLVHRTRQPGDGYGDERDVCLGKSLGERSGRLDRAALCGNVERARILIPADNVPETRPPGGETRRGPDEPGSDDG